ncbi:MAG: hypothetical protein WC080_01485 [Patescibacteria group bacterium]
MVFGINIGRRPGPEDVGPDTEERQIEPEVLGDESGWIRQGKVKAKFPSGIDGLSLVRTWGGIVWDNRAPGNKESAGSPMVLMTEDEANDYEVDAPFTDLRITEFENGTGKLLATPDAYRIFIEQLKGE